MIGFASLFLALVLGTIDVRLVAAPEVDAAQIFVDGRPVATVRSPWSALVDLGPLAPHELVAVAFDVNGKEIGRAMQWVNRPRALAEASLVLEPVRAGEGGKGRVARLTSSCVLVERPVSISVTLDGTPIPVPDPGRIELPPLDPEEVHLLRGDVDFGSDLTALAETIFGGARRADALSELTAIPVVFEGKVPSPDRLEGAFSHAGSPLKVGAVEEGPADVLVVLAGNSWARLRNVATSAKSFQMASRSGWPLMDRPLGKERRVRFVWPVPRRRAGSRETVTLFPSSPPVGSDRAGILAMAAARGREEYPGPQRIGETVASAGLLAAGHDRRRIVVLVFGSEAEETGGLTPAEVLGYLEALRVPLRVWSLERKVPPLAARFGDVVDVSQPPLLSRAVAQLREDLDRQRIVWVEGSHPPYEVVPTGKLPGLALAR